jgi:hypothetical protein
LRPLKTPNILLNSSKGLLTDVHFVKAHGQKHSPAEKMCAAHIKLFLKSVAHACSPSYTWEAEAGGTLESKSENLAWVI